MYLSHEVISPSRQNSVGHESKQVSVVLSEKIEQLIEKKERMKQQEPFTKIVGKLSGTFWMMCLLALLEKASIQPFKDNASEMF